MPLFDASTRSDGKGIDAQTLWNLLQTLNRSGIAGKDRLARPPERFAPVRRRINSPTRARRSATATPVIAQGSQAFQSVTISLVGPDGRRVGYGANADVLNSAILGRTR